MQLYYCFFASTAQMYARVSTYATYTKAFDLRGGTYVPQRRGGSTARWPENKAAEKTTAFFIVPNDNEVASC